MSIFSYFFKRMKDSYCIQVENSNDESCEVVLWDAANSMSYGRAENYGNKEGIVISVVKGEVGYANLLMLITVCPKRVYKTSIIPVSENAVTRDSVCIDRYILPGGTKISDCYSPAINKIPTKDTGSFLYKKFTLDALTCFKQKINGKNTLLYEFHYREKYSGFIYDLLSIKTSISIRKRYKT